MRWILFILILIPCYAVEVIICDYATGSYDCQIYSEADKPLEDVIHTYESEGFNDSSSQESDNEEPASEEPYEPLIFPLRRFW